MLSIFIPSFNHADYIVETIASARRIAVPNKHIYVIDDASTDNTAEVVEFYLSRTAANDVTFIPKPKNTGAIASLLMFLDMCRTEYVYTVASDDIVVPEGVSELVARLNSKPSLKFIIGGGKNLLQDGRRTPLYGNKHAAIFKVPAKDLVRTMFLTDPSPLLCQSAVFRLSALHAADAVDGSIVADDYAIFAKLFKLFNERGTNFDFMPDIDCVLYRHHENNSYRKIVRQAVTHCQVIDKVAPPEIRAKAIGYKISYLMLLAIRRANVKALGGLIKSTTLKSAGWVIVGLFMHTFDKLRYR